MGKRRPYRENFLRRIIQQVSGEAVVQALFSLNPVPKFFPIMLSVELCAHQLDPFLLQVLVSQLIKLEDDRQVILEISPKILCS